MVTDKNKKVLGYEWFIQLGAIGIYEPNEELFENQEEALADGIAHGYPKNAISIDKVVNEEGSTYVVCVKKATERVWLHCDEYGEKIVTEPIDS